MIQRLPGAPRIALVGCGRIAEVYHLPALTKHSEIMERLVLVDRDEARLQQLANQFNVRQTALDHHTILGDVDGAIIAVPHHLHYPITMDFLAAGAHVLCEKPLATSSREGRMMAARAREQEVTLSVNHTRRLFPAYGEIKKIIESGEIGSLRSIHYADGEPFNWQSASNFYFTQGAPTGVLLDKGVHGLDAICWWLGGKPTVVSSENDSFGGREGLVLLKLAHGTCTVEVKLSWLNRLSNSYSIVGELGTIEGGIEEWGTVTITRNSGQTSKRKLVAPEKAYNDFAGRIVDNFVDVIAGRAQPVVTAEDALASMELIEECYSAAVRFHMPWYDQPGYNQSRDEQPESVEMNYV